MSTAGWMNTVRRPVLFDSSVYIPALRAGTPLLPSSRSLPPGSVVWLSVVVLEELYAGTSGRDRQMVERLERDFTKINRVTVPNLSDWVWTGRVLARLAAKYGYERIGRGRLTNDALIAMSAARQGIVVLTANERDFTRISEFRSFKWEKVEPVPGL